MSDRLERALRALREGETGTNPKAEATLDRILATRRATGAMWGKRARTWLPIAAVLVIGTTALARSGSIGSVRALLGGRSEAVPVRKESRVVPAAPVPSVAAEEVASPAEAPSSEPAPADAPPAVALPLATAPASPPAPAPPAAPASPPAAPAPAPASAPRVTSALARAPAAAISAAPTSMPSINTPPQPPEPEPPSARVLSEGDVYARAHRLHFDGADPRVALAAWDDYLARYPRGRFAPDARYNRAIDLLKMKRYADARAALQPFADGSFGGYHAEDARELLRSIP
jgi:hypothetical protein